MKINGQTIKDLLDSDEYNREKIAVLSNWLIESPGEFWPAISRRTLGTNRLNELHQLSKEMIDLKTAEREVRICGEYLNAVLSIRRKMIEHKKSRCSTCPWKSV